MPLAYPLARETFFDVLPIASMNLHLPEAVTLARTAGGEQLPAELGERLWTGQVTLGPLLRAETGRPEVLIDILRGAGRSFLVYDRRRPAPLSDPAGAILGAAAPVIDTLGADARELRVGGLPVGYQLSSGDYLSFPYGEVPTNLLSFPQEFDNAVWNKSAATITANAIAAPDGTVTADKLVEAAADAQHFAMQAVAVTTAQPYTFSAYLRAAERNAALLQIGADGPFADFDAAAGTVTATGLGATGSEIENVGNGWYRCSVTGPALDSIAECYVILRNGGVYNYLGDGTSGMHVWNARLARPATVTRYALHRVVDPTVTAAAGGLTPFFEVTPYIRPGAVTGAAVTLLRAYCKAQLIFGSVAPMEGRHTLFEGQSFGFMQTLR